MSRRRGNNEPKKEQFDDYDNNNQQQQQQQQQPENDDNENNNNNQVNPLTLPSPIDKRKIFSLTSVSPFVRIAKKSEEKTKLKQRDEDETTPETTSSFIDVHAVLSKKPAATANHIPKPYVLPKGMPELPKDNLKEWFTMLEQAKRERKEALEILATMKEALIQAKESRDEANMQLETSTKTNSDLLNHITHLEAQIKTNKESYEKQLDELRILLENNKFHSNNTIEKWKKKYNSQSNAWTDKFELLKQRLEEQKKKTNNAIQLVKETKDQTASRTEQIKTDLEIIANKKCLKYEEENEKLLKEMNVLKSRVKHFTSQTVGRQQKLTDSNAIKAAYETTKRLKQEIESQNIKITNLNETNQELHEKNEELTSINASTTKEVETLKSFMRKRVNEANKAKEVVSDLLRNARYERARVEKQNETLTSKMKIANEEMTSYRKEINEKTRTIKRYDQSTNTLRREKDELKKQINLLNESKVKFEGEKDKIIQENFEKTSSIQELQLVKKQLQEDVVKIQKELKDALKVLKQTKSRVKQLESELRHEKANFKEQNENYRDMSRQSKAMQRKLQEERQERREEVAALVAKAEVATSRLTEALNAKHKTVMRLSQSNQKNQVLKDQLMQTQTQLHNAEGAAKEARQWGERALVQAKKSFSRKLIEEMSVLRSGHEQANKEVDEKNNEIIKLQDEIKKLMKDKDKSREDFMKFQQQHFYNNNNENNNNNSHDHGNRRRSNRNNGKEQHHHSREDQRDRHEQHYHTTNNNDTSMYKTREEIELDADIDEVDRMMEKERLMVERVMNNDHNNSSRSSSSRKGRSNRDHPQQQQPQQQHRHRQEGGRGGNHQNIKKNKKNKKIQQQKVHKRPPLLPQNVNTNNHPQHNNNNFKKNNNNSNRRHEDEDDNNNNHYNSGGESDTPPSTGAQDVILEATKFIRRRQQARRRAKN